jgi:ribosomal protein S18 acetylase RimI-like enzyme
MAERIDPTYRRARREDLPAMRLTQGLALRDLAAHEGRDAPYMPLDDQPTPLMRYLARRQPDLSWVATRDGQLLGFSQGFVHGDLWFLSNLFVHPNAQGVKIGAGLLDRCLQAGLRRGATVRAVSSSNDLSAQALYARAGMIPRFPLFALEGRAELLRKLPAPRAKVSAAKASATWIGRLGELDEYVWGRRRDADHRLALAEMKVGCVALTPRAGELSGYAYYTGTQVGPVAARTPRQALQLLRAAGDALGQSAAGGTPGQADKLRVTAPGINAIVLIALLEAGFRIDFSNLFMASRPFGRFDRYIPSGGTLL